MKACEIDTNLSIFMLVLRVRKIGFGCLGNNKFFKSENREFNFDL